MKKVVFVDDEHHIRQSIIRLVDWEKYDFECIGEASNGQEALSIIESQHPDVVITDIKMPIMDGLQLSEAIREFDPTIKIVILSGYDSFDYAQSAIRLNIHDYLLKPISREDLETTLEKISKAIDKERADANDILRMTKEYMASLDGLRQTYLSDLISQHFTSVDEGRLKNTAALYQLDMEYPHFVVIQLTLQDHPQFTFENQVNNESKDRLFNETIQWVSYITTVRGVIKPDYHAQIFKYKQSIVMVLNTHEPISQSQLDIEVLEIQQTLLRIHDVKVKMGISNIVGALNELRRAYQQSLNALNFCEFNNETNWTYFSDIETHYEKSLDVFEEMSDYLLSNIKVGDSESVKLLLSKLESAFMDDYWTNDDYFSYILEIFNKALRIYRNYAVHVVTLNINKWMDHLLAKRSEPFSFMFPQFKKIILEITNEIHTKREVKKESIVTKALQLMKEDFSNPKFNQTILADELHLSPNYLSGLIKKETGRSFKEHLIETRMLYAHELLLTTNKKLDEIAEKCGYVDPHYFSYGFKKYFGKSPRHLRDEFNEKERSKISEKSVSN